MNRQALRKPLRPSFDFWDRRTPVAAALPEILEGLRRPRKRLSAKYFYDERGSYLFEEICRLPEYYLTRAERSLLERRAREIAALWKEPCAILEYGCGGAEKIGPLLAAARNCRAYVGLDISPEPLLRLLDSLAASYPDVAFTGICADFHSSLEMPLPEPEALRRVAFFPGSSIGNFETEEALALLRRMADTVGEGGGLLIGYDLKKDKRILEAAYNDSRGVTAAFNKNILKRINYECDADFDETCFDHLAFYNETLGRIEMHLVSRVAQTVHLGLAPVEFLAGESIHTENSHKYAPEDFARLAARAGWRTVRRWADADNLFCLHYFETL